MTNPYLAVTDDEQYYTCPVDMDIMKCLISNGHYCLLSGGLHPVQGSTDCALALYFNNDNAIKSYCSITLNTFTKTQLLSLAPVIT